jgi:hypothetical protein
MGRSSRLEWIKIVTDVVCQTDELSKRCIQLKNSFNININPTQIQPDPKYSEQS